MSETTNCILCKVHSETEVLIKQMNTIRMMVSIIMGVQVVAGSESPWKSCL